MLQQYTDQIETIGLYGFYTLLFLLMGLSISEILKRSNVPKFGQYIVWAVLLLGCVGFIFKGLVEVIWTSIY
ncbi:MAG: DUF2788 domain-containing protein [Psychromonas sp.]|nr:DUF2788 domain-containing protein [Psychromonas sp.]